MASNVIKSGALQFQNISSQVCVASSKTWVHMRMVNLGVLFFKSISIEKEKPKEKMWQGVIWMMHKTLTADSAELPFMTDPFL